MKRVSAAVSACETLLNSAQRHPHTPAAHPATLPACVVPHAGGGPAAKKRLFLSVKGWQPGGPVAEDAHPLSFGHGGSCDEAPTPEDLPACLLRGSHLQLQTFLAECAQARQPGQELSARLLMLQQFGGALLCVRRSDAINCMCALSLPLQIAVNLPDGRSVQLPVFEAACVPDVTSRVAALLDCAPADVRLWPVGGGGPLVEADKVVPGACFHATLDTAPGGAPACCEWLGGQCLSVAAGPCHVDTQAASSHGDCRH